jgi:hypothetical protein
MVKEVALWCAVIALPLTQVPAPDQTRGPSCAEMETFLKTARIVSQREIPVGITVPKRATLDDGTRRHDASIQVTEVRKPVYEMRRSTELNFRDSWQFNVAGYELAKMLGLNMVPPYVERKVGGQSASVSWWIDDAMMERDRVRKKLTSPDPGRWNVEMYAVRVFQQLVYDTDPNQTNLLITRDWRIWMIDFSRAFRLSKTLRSPKSLVRIDRRLLARLRELTTDTVRERLGHWLGNAEIDTLLARRDRIVEHFDEAVAKWGESPILYDLARTAEPCGTGLGYNQE